MADNQEKVSFSNILPSIPLALQLSLYNRNN